MRIWNKSFGKEAKVADFAGRVMAKGLIMTATASSDGMWITFCRKAKGGVTADHNLVCCHILTNDEKADKFPCFNANGHSFEIIKVERHYEIRQKAKRNK